MWPIAIAAVVLVLIVAYVLAGWIWRRRVLYRTARRVLPVAPMNTAPPTALKVLPTFRGGPVPACHVCASGPGQPCWTYCPEATRRNFPGWG